MHRQVTVKVDETVATVKYRWFTPTIPATVIVPGVLLGVPALFVTKLPMPVGHE